MWIAWSAKILSFQIHIPDNIPWIHPTNMFHMHYFLSTPDISTIYNIELVLKDCVSYWQCTVYEALQV